MNSCALFCVASATSFCVVLSLGNRFRKCCPSVVLEFLIVQYIINLSPPLKFLQWSTITVHHVDDVAVLESLLHMPRTSKQLLHTENRTKEKYSLNRGDEDKIRSMEKGITTTHNCWVVLIGRPLNSPTHRTSILKENNNTTLTWTSSPTRSLKVTNDKEWWAMRAAAEAAAEAAAAAVPPRLLPPPPLLQQPHRLSLCNLIQPWPNQNKQEKN